MAGGREALAAAQRAEGLLHEAEAVHRALVREQQEAEAPVVLAEREARRLEAELERLRWEREPRASAPPPEPPAGAVPASVLGAPFAGDPGPPASPIVPRLAPDDPRLAWGGGGAPPVGVGGGAVAATPADGGGARWPE